MNWIKSVIEVMKMPVKFFFAICLFSGIIFLLPESLINKLQLEKFLKEYGMYISIAFIGSVSILMINFFIKIINHYKKRYSTNKLKELLYENFGKLDQHEKAVIREFYIQGRNTIELPMDNQVVAGLIKKRILIQVGSRVLHTTYGLLCSLGINEHASELITYDMIELPDHDPNEQERQRIIESRPRFILEIEEFNRFMRRI